MSSNISDIWNLILPSVIVLLVILTLESFGEDSPGEGGEIVLFTIRPVLIVDLVIPWAENPGLYKAARETLYLVCVQPCLLPDLKRNVTRYFKLLP